MILSGVEIPCIDVQLLESIHLVLHQRDKRGNHYGGPVHDQRGDLVTQRLATAGRHQNETVTAADDRVDNVLLGMAEAVVTKDFREYLLGFGVQGDGLWRVGCQRLVGDLI